ncbi:MAG: class I mannose-6-phosphate isomerase, partial [Pseudomonadota bacterium]|nr:class I mannose-6-phosphate isomerase [Pseudomonadota bacterium]
MTLRRLSERIVRKPWGRRDLPPPFAAVPESEEPVGEIWFEDPQGGVPPLLVKYLFTSEALSIQVHPDEARARAAGHRCGKDEAWLVLAAEEGARLGLGMRRPVGRDELRAAAVEGRVERLIGWRKVKAGDNFYAPAGTVHALGAGLTVVEVQRNVDVTYRLYDYGRPRELHVEEAVRAAIPQPWAPASRPPRLSRHRSLLACGSFRLERWSGAAAFPLGCSAKRPAWLVPLGA